MADRYGGWTGRPTIYGENDSSAANDNDSGPAAFTIPSSIGVARSAAGSADAAKRTSAARKLRPTDLFDDLAEDADTLLGGVPLCATRRRVRPD